MGPRVSRSLFWVLFLLSYLVLVHAAAPTGLAWVAGAAWLCLAMLVCLAFPGKWGLALLAVLAGLLLLVDAQTLLKFPPAVINLALAAWFGRTLAKGEEPIISWFARLVRGVELPADLARYTRNSTVMWTVFFLVMAAVATGLGALATPQTWSWFTNGIDYLLVGLLFVGEYAYRRIRYPHHDHAPLTQVVRTVMRSGKLTPRRTARK